MELIALYQRVIGLDIHQAQFTACALIMKFDGSSRIEQRQFGGFIWPRWTTRWISTLCRVTIAI